MTQAGTILSTIHSAPVSYFVYSSLSFYGARRGGALPGMWFVRAIGDAGRDAAAVRQTLYRMEREGELITRKTGRVKFYSATAYARAEIDAGTDRIFARSQRRWDGQWTIIHVALHGPRSRVERERIAALLAVEGFASLGNNTYAHPRSTGVRVRDALSAASRPHVTIIRGRLVSDANAASLIEQWNVRDLAVRYRRVLGRLRELEKRLRRAPVTNRDAFLLRFAVVFDYLGVAWGDPQLPPQLLPRDWPATEARRLAARLYTRLLPLAIKHADAILADAIPTERTSRNAR